MFAKHNTDTLPSEAALPARAARSILGAQTRIEGRVVGEEDLLVEGEVIGTLEFKHNIVTVGGEGRVQGDIFAQTLHVAGNVEGRLIASHKVVVQRTARISGSIVSPCLALEDGATFQGSIDMDPEHELLVAAFGDVTESTAAPERALAGSADEEDLGEPIPVDEQERRE